MMAIVSHEALRVLGRVAPSVLSKFLNEDRAADAGNDRWFFLDYSPADFPLRTSFDLCFSASGKMLTAVGNVSLEAVYDSFGHFFEDGIPKGYKTIAKLSFAESVPPAFNALPFLQGWLPNGKEILMTNTQNTAMNNLPELINDLAQLAVSDIQAYYTANQKISKQDFINLLRKSGLKNSEEVLRFLTLGGFVKEDRNEVELVVQK